MYEKLHVFSYQEKGGLSKDGKDDPFLNRPLSDSICVHWDELNIQGFPRNATSCIFPNFRKNRKPIFIVYTLLE